jgi:hypothetical protein
MDTLETKIDNLTDEINTLEGENKNLNKQISYNENEICKIIKDAIEKIVEDNTIILDNFKEQSLEKISEIIRDKKAYNKKRTDVDTKNNLLYDKIKEYIIITYIINKNENKNEDKVIGYYSKNGDVGTGKYGPIYTYICYIKTDEIKIYTTFKIQSKVEIILNEVKPAYLEDLKEIYKNINNREIFTIKT